MHSTMLAPVNQVVPMAAAAIPWRGVIGYSSFTCGSFTTRIFRTVKDLLSPFLASLDYTKLPDYALTGTVGFPVRGRP